MDLHLYLNIQHNNTQPHSPLSTSFFFFCQATAVYLFSHTRPELIGRNCILKKSIWPRDLLEDIFYLHVKKKKKKRRREKKRKKK
ncbi:hypothetical protein I7I50_09438 [Histoplasma capsulatum G186AR]|nr:hypothetical protein I7I50_09438 [Histoplasma capsulatum G186AR]